MSDIAQLYSRDPSSLSDSDIDEIVRYIRSRRAEFGAGQKQAGNVKKLDLNKQAKSAGKVDLDLTELGL